MAVAITPTAPSVPAGQTLQLKLTAAYSDGSEVDVTGQATWASETSGVASVDARTGLASGLKGGNSRITASYTEGNDTVSATATLAVSSVLQSISITPNPAFSGMGLVLQFAATGTYSDGTTADVSALGIWSSSAPSVATVVATTGVSTGVALGTSTVRFTLGSIAGQGPLGIVSGVWSPTNQLAVPYRAGSGILLPGGKVLLNATDQGYAAYQSQTYDPLTDQWTSTGRFAGGYEGASMLLLSNGQVLFAGGRPSMSTTTSGAWLYDPVSRTSTATARMSVERSYSHTLTLLPNNKVLAVGGVRDSIFPLIQRVDLYDPQSGTWSQTADTAVQRIGHTATLLPNGEVLVVGGCSPGVDCMTAGAVVERYRPDSGTWSPAMSPAVTRRRGHTATLLPNGRVLVVGGVDAANGNASLANCEIFDPVAGQWSAAQSLQTARRNHSATLLPDGRVLVAGGIGTGSQDPLLASTEIYDPGTNAWSRGPDLSEGSADHSAIRLPSGKLIIIKASPQLYW